jgi:hypothetical protein
VALVTQNKTNHERNYKKMKRYLGILGMALGFCLSAVSANAYTIWADNFEENKFATGWAMYKQFFTSGPVVVKSEGADLKPGYIDGYYPGRRYGPNAIESGQGGPDQGTYSAKLYPDYFTDQYGGPWGGNNVVVTALSRSHTVTNADLQAQTNGAFQMDLNYKFAELPGASAGAFAFMKIGPNWFVDRQALAFNDGYWGSAVAKISLDANSVGQVLEFGVAVYSVDYQSSAIYIDNVTVSNVPEPSTVSLLGFGVAGIIATRLRRRS